MDHIKKSEKGDAGVFAFNVSFYFYHVCIFLSLIFHFFPPLHFSNGPSLHYCLVVWDLSMSFQSFDLCGRLLYHL